MFTAVQLSSGKALSLGELRGRHVPSQGKSFAVIRAAQKKNIENIANRSSENCTQGDQGQ